MATEITLNATEGRHFTAKVEKQYYGSPSLVIECSVVNLTLHADDEQLAEIGEAIREHLERVGYHETPDQQQILNSELEEESHAQAD
ncbi:hypothetical protein [Paenibacillus koleovorans]|uniref:hypothetical protein n=1 Tax=Paenibacillus koleovorans TaxID=121608 RepID=UPI000FDC5BD3|nr:hypothetical protein [Paenibacillus koleovorans]